MKYPIFFILFSILTGYKSIHAHNIFLRILFIWLSFSFTFLAIVYLLNKPEWLGKKKDGKIKLLNFVLYSPWAVFSYIIWHIQRIISKENAYDEIVRNKIWCGRRLLPFELPNYVDTVIDLTSEFFEPFIIVNKINYISIPLLDGIQPNKDLILKLKHIAPSLINKKVLIHCAQGHGRTATVTTILMKYFDLINELEEGLEKIKNHRPKANISKGQLNFIRDVNNSFNIDLK